MNVRSMSGQCQVNVKSQSELDIALPLVDVKLVTYLSIFQPLFEDLLLFNNLGNCEKIFIFYFLVVCPNLIYLFTFIIDYDFSPQF